jgi:Flp pilus assembly protein TadG
MWAKLSASVRRIRTIRLARRFARQQSGIAAVEFGMIGAPFLAMIFAILETSIIFFAGQALESAVADSGRLIMTGQAQTQGFDQNAFKNAVCAKVYGLFDCANGVSIEVKSFPTFAAIAMPQPLDAGGNFVNNFGYDPGGPCSIVLVRIFYQWPVYVSLLDFNKMSSNMAGSKRLLVATSAFRNEPYGTSGC